MISVCIASHNGSKYIKEQIESILPQLETEDEIIVSDDGSTDDTIAILKQLNDFRIKIFYYKQPDNPLNGSQKCIRFATKNFENALSKASGDIIFLCDQDDVWYPEKINTCKEMLKQYDIIKHDYSIIDENGKLVQERVYNAATQRNRSLYHLWSKLPFRGCCTAFKRQVLSKALPFPADCLQHDTWIGMVARISGFQFDYLDQPLIYHRHHSKNASELTVPNSLIYKIKYRLKLLSQIIKYKRNRRYY